MKVPDRTLDHSAFCRYVRCFTNAVSKPNIRTQVPGINVLNFWHWSRLRRKSKGKGKIGGKLLRDVVAL